MKKIKSLRPLTALAASAVLALSGCSLADSTDIEQTESATVTSASLSVTADTVNLDPGDTSGIDAEFTLTLTDTAFAFGAEAGTDLSGYIAIKAVDAEGNAVSTLSTGKIRTKDAFAAGEKTVTVYTTISDSGEVDVANGKLKVSVSGGALQGSGKVSNLDAEIDVQTCELTAVEVKSTGTAKSWAPFLMMACCSLRLVLI